MALTSNSYVVGTLDALKEEERSYGSIMIEKLTGNEDGRVDHALQVRGKHSPFVSLAVILSDILSTYFLSYFHFMFVGMNNFAYEFRIK